MTPEERIQLQLLIVRSRMGEADAFAELVGEYRPRLLYYLRRLLGDSDHAEDALQDVWLAAFRRLGGLRSPDAFPVWIYRIARAKAVEIIRREKRYVELSEDFELPDHLNDDTDEETFSPEDAARVHRAVEQLRPLHREVLALKFIEGMSIEEIALVVGCAPGTVKSRIHYAKQVMKKAWEAENGQQR